MEAYQEFLKAKRDYGADSGFEPLWMPDFLFGFQRYLTDWAIRKGRAAIFADCGMGKTPMQLVWAQNVIEHTGKPVLILTPLAVSRQTLEEADKFGVEAYRAQPDADLKPAVYVTNYEQLPKYEPTPWGGMVCDESSILKNSKGVTSSMITEFMRTVPYRLLATATPAPNDWLELGTSSEALGWMGYADMKSKFFTNKSGSGYMRKFQHHREKIFLRSYAAEGPFWRWIASWARAARKPSDLGFDNDGFVLPPLVENDVKVELHNRPDGMLFDLPATSFHDERAARRRSLRERCEEVARRFEGRDVGVAWVNLNDEGDLIEDLIPDAVQVTGSDSTEYKEEVAHWFRYGDESARRIVTKPEIFGFGLNWQHANYMTYFPTHSYERYYQASRRLWRFGQTEPVVIDRIYSNGGKLVLENMARKAEAAGEMYEELVRWMNEALEIEDDYEQIDKLEVPQWI